MNEHQDEDIYLLSPYSFITIIRKGTTVVDTSYFQGTERIAIFPLDGSSNNITTEG